MRDRAAAAAAGALLTPPLDHRFDERDLAGAPEPARRMLSAAIAPGTPLAQAAHLRMRGQIKLRRWLPFTAREWLAPREGFVWQARVAGVIGGHDMGLHGRGEMLWRLAGIVTVMKAAGPEIARSGVGRAGAEALWVPTVLAPPFETRWSSPHDSQVTGAFEVGGQNLELCCDINRDGKVTSFSLERWGDPDSTGSWRSCPFGGVFTSHRRFGPVTIPAAGRIGWFYGTPRWPDGEFFRFEVTGHELIGADVSAPGQGQTSP